MNKRREFFRRLAEIGLMLALIVVLIIVFRTIPAGMPVSTATIASPSSVYPPPPSAYLPPSAYPPPEAETAPTRTEAPPEEIVPLTPSGPPPTLTPWPTFTPFPSPTLRLGPTDTPVPLVTPAKDASGSILYLASMEKGMAALYSLPVGAQGMTVGAAAKLSGDMDLSWGSAYPSPDGKRIALFGEWGAQAILYTDSGKMEAMFKDTIGPGGRFFAWHPDSRHLLMRADENYADLGLWLVDTNTWEHAPLAVPGIGRNLGGAVSPDGRTVIYSYQKETFSPSEVWMVNADGRGARLLFTVNGTATNFAWSPDGSKVVFSGEGLMVISAKGEKLRSINVANCSGRGHYPPIWSPDSRYLAMMSDRSDLPYTDPWNPEAFQDTNICLVDVESGEARPLLPGESAGNMHPSWSPDGSQIAFVSNHSGTSEIWTVNVDGSDLLQLTSAGMVVRFPYWRRP